MPELQPFEIRLSTAIRSFADRAETRVDAVAVAERAIRRRPSAGAGWLGRTVPVPVWILLMVGLLLVLFSVVLQAGRMPDVRQSAIASCPVGSDPDRPGPVDQERPRSEFGFPVAFDRESGRLVAVAGDPWQLWTFDVCSNTWREPGVSLPARPRAIAYDEAADLTILFSDPVVAYDVDGDSLTTLGARPVPEDVHAVYRSALGQLVVRDDLASRLWTYDVTTDTWQELAQRGELPPGPGTGASLLAYDRSVDRLVLYTRAGSHTDGYEFDPDSSTWTHQPIDPPELFLAWGDLGRYEVAYDEAHARTVLFSRGQVITYDATAGRWQDVSAPHLDSSQSRVPADPHRGAVSLAYDPVNERVISVGGNVQTSTDWVVADDVIAFDLPSRSWIELLAPADR